MIPLAVAILMFVATFVSCIRNAPERAQAPIPNFIYAPLLSTLGAGTFGFLLMLGGGLLLGPRVETTTQTQEPLTALDSTGPSYVATLRNEDGSERRERLPGDTRVFRDADPEEGHLVRRTTVKALDPTAAWWWVPPFKGILFEGLREGTTSEVVEVHAPRP